MRHQATRNTARRHCGFMGIDKIALAEIDAVAAQRGITRGEAITYIVREMQREIKHLHWRQNCLEAEFAKVR